MLKRWIKRAAPRVAVIGLDCAEPSLVFDRFQDDLPTLTRLRQRGVYGRLESVIPAITVPAWSCMFSGKDPGALGIYGFRNRADYDYHHLVTANGDAVREDRLWDILSRYGKRSTILNVPGTYPPRPLAGEMIACFLTPDPGAPYTYPPSLKDEIEQQVGAYKFDVPEFRTDDKARLIADVRQMTEQHFAAARYLARTRAWDLFITVEIGLDRMHHALWAAMDETHPMHDPRSPFKDAIRDYYRLLDAEIARLIACFPPETHLLIVSDHGAQRMDGGICINEWLLREGYLALKRPLEPSAGIKRLDQMDVDWTRTRAWGEGGYYGRLFVNLAGREPEGIVPPEAVDGLLRELSDKLAALGDEHGRPIGTRCFRPAELYARVNGLPPDLLIYFGDLSWRSIGTLGWGKVHIHENDTGPDDANHAQHGLFIYAQQPRDLKGRVVAEAHLLQIAPTVLQLLGVPTPADIQQSPLPVFTTA